MTNSPTDPGWFPDPKQPGLLRYWTGSEWTDRTAPAVAPPQQPSPAALKQDTSAKKVVALVLVSILAVVLVGYAITSVADQNQKEDDLNCLIQSQQFGDEEPDIPLECQ